MTYTMHFTAINGVQPHIPENVEETIKDTSSEGDVKPVTITGQDLISTHHTFEEIKNKNAETKKQYIGN